MLDAVGKPIEVGSILMVASRRQATAYLSRQVVREVESRLRRRWDMTRREYVDVPDETEYRVSVELSNGRIFTHDWRNDLPDRAVVVGSE